MVRRGAAAGGSPATDRPRTRRRDLGAVDRLVLEQAAGHQVEAVAVLGEELAAALLAVAEDLLDLLVDDAGGLVGVVAGVAA